MDETSIYSCEFRHPDGNLIEFMTYPDKSKEQADGS
jgi:predicted lactoylglutathione lyase